MDAPRTRRRFLRSALLAILGLAIIFGIALYFRPLWAWRQTTQIWLRVQGIGSSYAQLGPYRIQYFVGGKGSPVVLLHGLGGEAGDWALSMPALMRGGFRVYAIDLLGYGRSDRPDVDYSIALQSDIVRQFLDRQGLERADFAGWSMGGWIALKFALDHPERVHRVVLYDSAGISFKPPVDPRLFAARTRQDLRRLYAALSPRPLHIPQFVARDLLRQAAERGWVVRRSLDSMQAGHDLLDGKLGAIHAPVLIVWGKQDALIPLSCGEEMHREMPQSLLVALPGCGHLAPVECRRQTLADTMRFLRADVALVGELR
ncbi:MAG TPA: alpha/beta fold hydrolase [Terriglobia bacterium]|nr:alpha/beta fold hydrolase [Terriglobia bacterium]